MNFGRDSVFREVCAMLKNADSTEGYARLYRIVQEDTMSILRKTVLPWFEQEEIHAEVQKAVFVGLAHYAEQFANKSEDERNKYLCGIIRHKRADSFRKMCEANRTASYDEEERLLQWEIEEMEPALLDREENWQGLMRVIGYVCALPTTPDKIAAFFLNRCSAWISGNGSNGKPAEVVRRLENTTQADAVRLALGQMEALLQRRLPEAVTEPLWAKLEEDTPNGKRGTLAFRLTSREITDSSSWIMGKIRRNAEQFAGGPCL